MSELSGTIVDDFKGAATLKWYEKKEMAQENNQSNTPANPALTTPKQKNEQQNNLTNWPPKPRPK
jgi:hypothetical protein